MNKQGFVALIAQTFPQEECNLIMMAYDFSKYAHRNQEREFPINGSVEERRYFNHPLRLAITMIKAGVRDWMTICEAFLHDTVEDRGIFGNQKTDGYEKAMDVARFRLTRIFNEIIAEDVISLTIPMLDEDTEQFSTKTKCLTFYKEKLRGASVRAVLNKEFDRLDNLSTIEVKGESVARLKIAETRDFYIPLFVEKFSDEPSPLKRIGFENIPALITLITDKAYLLDHKKTSND